MDVSDEGTESVSDIKGMDVMEVTRWEDLEELYLDLLERPDKYSKYKTIVIDTITQAQQAFIEGLLEGKNLKGKQAGDWGTMTKQDWGTLAGALKSWITNMRNLPFEVVFIAQDRLFNLSDDEETAVEDGINPEVGPSCSPAVSKHLCAASSIIGYTAIRSRVIKKKNTKGKTVTREVKEYGILLGPHDYYITKVRKPKDITVPDFLVDPTHEEILELINGE